MSPRSVLIVLVALSALLAWFLLGEESAEETLPVSTENEAGESEAATAPGRVDHSAEDEVDTAASANADNGNESESRSRIVMGGDDLDVHAVEDVDARRAELEAAFEAGDVHAAYQLYQLAFACSSAPRAVGHRRQRLEDESDPREREQLKEQIQRLAAIEESCDESSWGNPRTAYENVAEWHWKAAEAGHADAMYRVVFGGMGRLAREGGRLPEDEAMAVRRDYLERLRDACHADSLHSMGVHLSRDSAVTADFELHEHWDRDGDSARQMEGFAHRYAAARLREDGRPAEQARIPDQLLTAAEETQAVAWARNLLSDCS